MDLKKSSKQKILEKCKQQAELTSLHGIPGLVRAENNSIRVIWCLSLIGSLYGCYHFIYQLMADYFTYPFSTSIEIVFETPLTFPAVSFCSLSKSFANMSLADLMLDCSFDGTTRCLNYSDDYFQAYEDPEYLKCFRFNSGLDMLGRQVNVSKSSLPGRIGGFQIGLKEKAGLAVSIHSQSVRPFPFEFYNNINGDTIYVTSGFMTDISFERIVTKRLGEPYNNCVKEPNQFNGNKTLIQYILNKNQSYTQSKCINIYFALKYLTDNECGCGNATLDNVWSECFIRQEKRNQTGCTSMYRSRFYRETISLQNYTDKYCPLECDFDTFTTSYSFQPFVSLPTQVGVLRNESVRLMVYFKESKYTVISQSAIITIADIVSYCGGVLGVFVGFSFLSLIEFVNLFIEVVLIAYRDYLGRTRFMSFANKIRPN